MPFPDGLPTKLVTLTATNPVGGTAATGTVRLSPNVPAIVIDGTPVQFTGSGTYKFDAQGRLVDTDGTTVGVRLLDNSAAGSNPAGWLWHAIVTVDGQPPHSFHFTLAGTLPEVDLTDLMQVEPGLPRYVAVPGPQGNPGPAGADGAPGAPGPSAYQVAVTEGFAGTEEEWLATLVGPQGEAGPQGPQPELGAAGAGADIALRSTDPSTTNSRTPTAHAASHATGGSDPLTAAAIAAEPAGTAAAAVTTHTSADDPHSYKTWADAKFALATGLTALNGTVNNLSTTVTAIDGYLNDALNRVAAIEQGTAWLGGLQVDGDAQVANGNLTVGGNLSAAGNALGQDTPATHGVAAWCYDPALAVNSTAMTNGTLYLTRVDIAANVNVTKLYWWIGNSGSSPVSGQNQVGLYDSAGTLLAAVNVDAAISSATLKTTTIPAQALAAGSFYWIAMLFNASVPPTLTRGSGWTGVDTAANLGLTAATYRFARNGTGRTALPSSIVPAANVGTDFAGPWAAIGA